MFCLRKLRHLCLLGDVGNMLAPGKVTPNCDSQILYFRLGGKFLVMDEVTVAGVLPLVGDVHCAVLHTCWH